jgi:hypothetical protein
VGFASAYVKIRSNGNSAELFLDAALYRHGHTDHAVIGSPRY